MTQLRFKHYRGVCFALFLAGCPNGVDGPEVGRDAEPDVDVAEDADVADGDGDEAHVDSDFEVDGHEADAEGGAEGDAENERCSSLTITAPEGGHLYLDNEYSGLTLPTELPLPSGELRVGLSTDDGRYLERTVDNIPPSCELFLGDADEVDPQMWRGLFVGVQTAQTESCSPTFSMEQLDAVYDYFEESITDHFERFTMSLHRWEIDRVDLIEPVAVTSPHGYLTIEPDNLPALDDVTEGEYDIIIVVWRGMDETCEIPAPYFGLASPPTVETKGAGWIAVRTPEADVLDLLEYLRDWDPGVFIHEWLHVAVEWHYFQLGAGLPQPASDGSILHNGEYYGYAFPWMDWYQDLISGRVEGDGEYVGVTPDHLRACTIRGWVSGDCH